MKFVPVKDDSNARPGQIDRAFFDSVYEQVAKVPAGFVCTYGDIARLAGYPGLARQVGAAMAGVKPEQNLPCHRIVNSKGTLAPNYAFGGRDVQRAFLEEEGVTFKAGASEPTIDMEAHRWPRPEISTEEPDPEQLSLDFWNNL